jgi:hypothetical protein
MGSGAKRRKKNMSRQIMVKRQADHNPSRSWKDIRLAERQYLVQGPVMNEGEGETSGGIWIPITRDMRMINVAKVLKKGPGCTLAEVGEYVVFCSITGDNFNHLKPQPVYRDYFDEDGLYTLHEENLRAVIPEGEPLLNAKELKDLMETEEQKPSGGCPEHEVVAVEVGNGKDLGGSQGGQVGTAGS